MNVSRSRLAAALVLALAYGCMDTTAQQCRSAAECEPILGVAPGTAACIEGVCEKFSRGTDLPPASAPACHENAECLERTGEPSLCRDEKCVRIGADDLSIQTSDNYAKGDPIFVGFIAPLTTADGYRSEYDEVWVNTAKLAAMDWDNATHGGVLPAGAKQRRPIAAVFCDSRADAQRAAACARHLTETLRAPVVVARSKDETGAILPVTSASRALLFCSDCSPADIDATGNQGLLWYLGPPLEDHTAIRVAWLDRVAKQIRTTPDIKVAFIANGTIPQSEQLRSQLAFNGTTSQENEKNGRLLWINADQTTDWLDLAKRVVAMRPDIVMTGEIGLFFHSYVLPEIEARWGAGTRPQYILSESESFDGPLQRSIGINAALRRRITGVWTNPSDAVNSNWEAFNDAYVHAAAFGGEDPGGNVTGFEAFYAASYGIVAALNGANVPLGAFEGAHVAAGLGRVVGGSAENIVDFRVGDIERGVRLLEKQEVIDVRGVYTDLDWDPITGVLHSDAAIWCPSTDALTGTRAKPMWIYSQRQKQPVGTPDPNACTYGP